MLLKELKIIKVQLKKFVFLSENSMAFFQNIRDGRVGNFNVNYVEDIHIYFTFV